MTMLGNDYNIQGILGEGSFSRVFKIQHKLSGIQFAGKHLKRIFKRKQDIISCMEINVMKRIEDHPNILNLKDIICESFPCHIVLVFELMDMNLYEFLKDKQKPLSESISRIFFYQIVCGVHHLHRNGIFHRDVKPENVLLKFPKIANGISQEFKLATLKLADFGSAKSIEMELPLTDYVATRWYRAPECIITGGYYGPKLDVWSTGCIFYEMLTLRPLFPGDTELDQLEKIHRVLGSPSACVLRRLRHLKVNFEFPKQYSVDLAALLPNLSKLGLNVFKACINYLPDTRIDSTKLEGHSYFADVRNRTPKSARNYEKGQKSDRALPTSSNKLLSPTEVKPHSPLGNLYLKQRRLDESDIDKIVTVKSKRPRKQNQV